MRRKKTATLTGRTNTTKANVATKETFTIKMDWLAGAYYITRTNVAGDWFGTPLRDSNGWTRYFATRNSARKRISRERRGDFHN